MRINFEDQETLDNLKILETVNPGKSSVELVREALRMAALAAIRLEQARVGASAIDDENDNWTLEMQGIGVENEAI